MAAASWDFILSGHTECLFWAGSGIAAICFAISKILTEIPASHSGIPKSVQVKRQTQHIPEPVATDTLRPCSNSIRAHASGPSSTRSHPRQSGRSGRCAPANVPLRSDTPALLQNVVPAPADGPYRGNQLAV
eukprot:1162694-Pleurochrysis_carterae.AAC.6